MIKQSLGWQVVESTSFKFLRLPHRKPSCPLKSWMLKQLTLISSFFGIIPESRTNLNFDAPKRTWRYFWWRLCLPLSASWFNRVACKASKTDHDDEFGRECCRMLGTNADEEAKRARGWVNLPFIDVPGHSVLWGRSECKKRSDNHCSWWTLKFRWIPSQWGIVTDGKDISALQSTAQDGGKLADMQAEHTEDLILRNEFFSSVSVTATILWRQHLQDKQKFCECAGSLLLYRNY